MIKDTDLNIGGYFKLSMASKLGSGAFGEIYMGLNTKTNEEVAVKIESNKIKHPQLLYESKVLKYLQGGVGIPNLHYFSSSSDYNYMVIDLLGLSLEDIIKKYSSALTLKTVLMLFDQMLTRIEFLHTRHFIHRDIKPDNFLLGNGRKKHQIYLIDYGLAKRFRDPKTGEHIPYKDGKSLTGTARYASIYTHLGIEQSRRDDLEGLGYVIMYFLRGSLPWQGLKAKNKKDKYQKIMDCKIANTPEKLCNGFPEEFLNYFQYCRSLQFNEKPDYNYLKMLFKNLFSKKELAFDYNYDWIELEKKKKDLVNNIFKINPFQYDENQTPAPNEIDKQNDVNLKIIDETAKK